MKTVYTLLFLLLTAPCITLAQVNFKPGVVVTNGDTLRGYINYQEWIKSPESIQFKISQASTVSRRFTAQNSDFFEVTGYEAYQKYSGPISMNSLTTGTFPTGPDLAAVTDTVFLKEIATGPFISLLSFTDGIKTRYFVKDRQHATAQELVYVKHLDAQNLRSIQSLTPYRGQLWGLATKYGRGTAALEHKIKKVKYTEKELRQVVHLINGLSEGQSEQLEKKLSKNRLLLGAGLLRGTMSYREIDGSKESQQMSVAYSPALVVGFDTFLNRHTRRLLIRSELTASQVNHTIQKVRRWAGTDSRENNEYDLSYYSFSFSPQIIYNLYHTDELKLYVGGGIEATYSSFTKNTLRVSRYYYGNSTGQPDYTTTRDNYAALYNLWYSVPLRVGVISSDKYDLGLVYYKVLEPGLNASFRHNSLKISFNYLFTKR
ncbi:hypothetical protein [Pontibacter litorisediminis]|uniref:hypothetical protein n=1 Tax=Pontibacter litorisediminis TaxID=1846260 RepID=UPI0023ED19A1|nr:hypothetical protein [Pontibacter litorisediminis]